MDKSIKKKISGRLYRKYFRLAGAAFAFIILLALFCVRRLRNRGTEIFPDRDFPVREEVVYRQKDERWAEEKLGNSRYTMSSSGCLVSCIAASLQLQGREELNPGSLNQELSRISGYDEEGNLQWDALSKLDSRILVERCNAVDNTALMDSLEAGRFPIVRVRLNGVGSVHYVLLIGAKDGNYWCMDPLNQSEKAVPLSNFGNRVYAVRYTDWHN